VPLPLHIFEPRYQQMLIDVGVSNNLFGVSYFDPNTSENAVPPAGCAAGIAQ
jgi:Lon protease-like protein